MKLAGKSGTKPKRNFKGRKGNKKLGDGNARSQSRGRDKSRKQGQSTRRTKSDNHYRKAKKGPVVL